MNTDTDKMEPDILSLFLNVIDKIKVENINVTDLYIDVNYNTMQITVYDDNDGVLDIETISGWQTIRDNDNYEAIAADSIKEVLSSKTVKEKFESLGYSYPVSVILIDEDGKELMELITYDKDNICIQDNMVEKMCNELDDYVNKLLADI
ncbi:MAG: hypothetical protein RR293_02835 [Bacteroidales bacterium]